MTYLPDSVLVEKVAKALWDEQHPHTAWPEGEAVSQEIERDLVRAEARAALSVACPLVAGVIADRLDEWVRVMNPDAEFFGGPWDCAGFVRSEYGEQT